jgi:hypothetical protein
MPTIFHLKRLLKSSAATDQLLLFCDLHGGAYLRGAGKHKPRGSDVGMRGW